MLNPCIKQKDGLLAAKWALINQSQLKNMQINHLLERLKMAMGNNYFWFKGEYYNQIKGVAMGAGFAPSVANLGLNKWEQESIYGQEWQGLKFYKRYVDDIILLWENNNENYL